MTAQQILGSDLDFPTTSGLVEGRPLSVGDGFTARSFRHEHFDGLMDPLVMVDHYTMTAPTFGAHPHAGMSAVSVLFEDSVGRFRNRDSMGSDFDLQPGDLYWLKAGAGAVHDESPRAGARIHGLQLFVNLPGAMKEDAPRGLHVPAASMPVVEADGARVRVVLGESNGVVGATSPALPMTILDAGLRAGGAYAHALPAGQSAWLYAVQGDVGVLVAGREIALRSGSAMVVRAEASDLELTLRGEGAAQVVLIQGAPVGEAFVQRGPFVMSDDAANAAKEAAFARGDLGSILAPEG